MRDWGGKDLKDVVAGANYLKALPEVDPDRIGIWGGSYGGFMTYIALTKEPDYWKAGVAWVGISDLLSMYNLSMPHFKIFLKEQMGDPEENLELWKDRSAVNFAQNLKTKLLILHGVNDPRCPVQQARIFRDKLLELGFKEGEDFIYLERAEGHGGWSDVEARIQTIEIVVNFFDRNL